MHDCAFVNLHAACFSFSYFFLYFLFYLVLVLFCFNSFLSNMWVKQVFVLLVVELLVSLRNGIAAATPHALITPEIS